MSSCFVVDARGCRAGSLQSRRSCASWESPAFWWPTRLRDEGGAQLAEFYELRLGMSCRSLQHGQGVRSMEQGAEVLALPEPDEEEEPTGPLPSN